MRYQEYNVNVFPRFTIQQMYFNSKRISTANLFQQQVYFKKQTYFNSKHISKANLFQQQMYFNSKLIATANVF